MKKVIKFIAKFLLWFFVGIIGLIAIALIAIQTPYVKSKIVQIAQQQVNKALNAQISVGELSGNIFTGLNLDNVLMLSAENDTIAFVPRIELNYQLLPLLRNKILVDRVELNDPYIHLLQLPDSTWNLQYITKPSDTPKDTPSTFNWQIVAHKIKLNNGNVRIDAYNTNIPRKVNSLFLEASGIYSTDEQEVKIDELRLITLEPEIILQQLTLQAKADKENIELEELLLRTAENEITGNGNYNIAGIDRSFLELNTAPLILEEFRYYLPENFHLGATPILNLDADIINRNLTLNAVLKDSLQQIDLKVLAYQLLEYFTDSTTSPVTYDVAVNMDKIDLRYWLADNNLNYRLNGLLTAQGEGLDPNTLKADIQGDFNNIFLYVTTVNKLELNLNYLAGNVKGIINGFGNFGTVRIIPNAQRILSQNPSYQVDLTSRKLNLAPFIGDRYKTSINMNADVKGTGFNFRTMNASTAILMDTSYVMGFFVDTLNSQIDLVRQNFIVKEFVLESMSVHVKAEGNYDMNGPSDLTLEAQVDNAAEIARFANLEDFQTRAHLLATVQGNPSDLNVDANLELGLTRYQNIRLDTLFAAVTANIQNPEIEANADIHVNRLSIGSNEFEDVHLTAETDTRNFNLRLDAAGDDLNAQMNSIVQLGDATRIYLNDLYLDYKGYAFGQVSDTAYISIGANEYEVREFHLVADSSSIEQTIYIDGIVRREGEQDLQVNIENIDLKRIGEIFAPDREMQGFITLDAQIEGSSQAPVITGDLHVDSALIQDFRFDTIQTNVRIAESMLSADLNIVPRGNGSIIGDGRIPMEVRLDSMMFKLMPRKTDPLEASLLIDNIPLSIINIFLPSDEVSGTIESKIDVEGTVGSPDIEGNLYIRNGRVKIDQYGVNYRNIQTAVQVMNDGISVDTFLIQSNDGNMTADGNIRFNSEIYNTDFSSSEIKVHFDRFNPIDHRQYNMELSGDVDLTATADSVVFNGDLQIPDANIYIPAIMNIIGRFNTPNLPKPLLVAEMERMLAEQDSILYGVRPVENPKDTAPPRLNFMNNVQGKVKLDIPRNVWIRNDDFRVELSGDVELLKHRDFFELFGTIDVIRGQYNLFGKVFVIESGSTVTFQGGEELNPILNVEAVYSFRDNDRTKRDLNLSVTGELQEPKIQFTYDGAAITEGDAISYILFGMNMDALTSGQQSSLTSSLSAAGIAETAAASLISSQLTRFLGNTINVDYIELKAGSSFDNLSVTVGKYITNKLFVSYEQHIGALEETDEARYEVTAEYELFRFLFLQLSSSPITTGFDVIFKINSNTKFE